MKSVGIVRRIDELGRVVIPKEIRRTHRLGEGTQIEIYTDRDGKIVIQKYSPITQLSNFASEYVNTLKSVLGCDTFICDKDVVLADSCNKNSEYRDAYISKNMIAKIEDREALVVTDKDAIELIEREDLSTIKGQIICPVIMEGDPIGAVVSISRKKAFDDSDVRVVKTVALLLENQLMC